LVAADGVGAKQRQWCSDRTPYPLKKINQSGELDMLARSDAEQHRDPVGISCDSVGIGENFDFHSSLQPAIAGLCQPRHESSLSLR
jgi:hypothetical protein